MKFTKYLVGLAASAGLLFGCQELEMVQICDPSEVVPPVLAEVEDLTITADNQTENAVFTWDAADFGAKVAVNYALEAKYGEGDIYEVVSGLSGTSYKISYEILNQNLYNGLGLPSDTPVEINFYISAKVGEDKKYYSAPVKAKVQVTAAEKKYPMVYVIGNFNNWSDGTTQELFDFAGTDTKYSGIVGFSGKAANGFKVRGSETGWDNAKGNWGLDGSKEAPAAESATIELMNDGGSGDIKIYSKNFYNMTLDKTAPSLTMNFSFNSIGVIGTAVGGWDADIDFQFNTENQKFFLDVTLVEGEMKFRADDDWAVNWGVATPGVKMEKGVLDGSENITVPAGNYRIYLNFNNPEELTFELNANDYGAAAPETPVEPEPEVPVLEGWGLVGEHNNWGETADIMLTETAGFLAAKNVALEASKQFKLRKDGKWDENRGAEGDVEPFEVTLGTALKLVANGKNLTVPTTGEYDIYFDEAKDEIYVLVAGSAVPGTDLVPSEWGIVGDINGWAAPDITMYKTATEGMFAAFNVTFTADGGFKIRANGEWNDAANYGLATAGSVEVGKSYDLVCSGGSGNMTIKAGVYDIWFDLTNSKVYILEPGKTPDSAEGGEAVVPDPSEQTWHIVGSFNAWKPDDAAYIMTAEGDWYVYKNFTAPAGCELKFAPGAWSGDKGGNGEAFAVDTEFATGSLNIAVAEGTYNVWLKKDLSVYKFTVAGGESTFEPQASQWGIVGQINGWAAPDITMYTTPTADLFVVKSIEMPAGPFKIRANGEWNDAANYGLATAGDVVVDHVYDVITSGGSGNMNLAAGTYDIYFDLAHTKVYIMTPGKPISEAVGSEVVTPPAPSEAVWTLVGAFNGWPETPDSNYNMTKEGDWYVFKGFTTEGGEMKFYSGGWDVNRGGAFTAVNEAVEISQGGPNVNLPAGTYDIYMNAATDKAYFMEPGKTPVGGDTIKIIYKNPANWSNVNMYTWGDIDMGAWPGKAMSKVGNDYVMELSKDNIGKSFNLIFNNGSGAQTVDLGPFTLEGDMTFDNSNAQIK